MSDSVHPPQRQVRGRMWTPSGWLSGEFHVPRDEPLLDFLNGTADFFTLTGVQLQNQQNALPFLALQRSATLLVVPPHDTHLIADSDEQDLTTRQVSCLLQGAVVMGSLRLPASLRVSDHLMQQGGFILLRDCTVGTDEPRAVQSAPVAIANASRVVGVAEMP